MNDPHHNTSFTINPGDIIHVPSESVRFFHKPKHRFHSPSDTPCVQPMMVRLHQPDDSCDRWDFPANSWEKGHGLVMFGPELPPEGGEIRVLFRDRKCVCTCLPSCYEELAAALAAQEEGIAKEA